MKRKNVITVTMNPSIDVTLWMDGLHPDKANRVLEETREVGGKGINVSRVVNSFGLESLSLTIAGKENSREFATFLESNGLRYEMLQVAGLVRENYTLRFEDETLKVNRKGPAVSALMMTAFMALIESRMKAGDIVVFGGSLPENVSIQDFIELIVAVKNAGALIALDTDFLSLEDYRCIKPWLIKPNIHELQNILPIAEKSLSSISQAAKQLVDEGVENALVSLGSQGLMLVTNESALHAAVPEVEVKSTVGAGDSALGGFLVGTIKGYSSEDTLRLAAACGTVSVMHDGTAVATKQESDKMRDAVSISSI